MKRPLLLDLDGPLNPYRQLSAAGFLPRKLLNAPGRFGFERFEMAPCCFPGGASILLSRGHEVAFEVLAGLIDFVWATIWEDDANLLISPVIGLLGDLPAITWSDGPKEEACTWLYDSGHAGSPETKHIAAWLHEDHPVRVWARVDDELTSYDDRWLIRNSRSNGTPAPDRLLLRIGAVHGLRQPDFDTLRTFDIDSRSAS